MKKSSRPSGRLPAGRRSAKKGKGSLPGDEPEWRERYRALVVFHRARGHCDVPSQAPQHRALAAWLTTQRERAAKGRLDGARKRALEELGVDFTGTGEEPAAQDAAWESRLAELTAFHSRFGHTRVTKAFSECPALANWRHYQRVLQREGKLSPERKARLDALGFAWEEPATSGLTHVQRLDLEKRREYFWEQHRAQLAAIVKKTGRCVVPKNRALSKWIVVQRKAYREGSLSEFRVKQLEAIGFVWNPGRSHFDAGWEKRYAELAAFHRRFGHTRVSKAWKKNPGLGHWRHFQRILHREGKMAPARKRKLDALGFEWEESHANWQSRIPQWEKLWERRFAELRAFKKRFRHCLVITGWPENPLLAKWVHRQRTKYRTGLLRTDQIQRLEALGFAWESDYAHFHKAWEQRFKELTAFHRRFGHTRVTKTWREHPGLYSWRHHQREQYRQGTLDPSRKARLDALGFEWIEQKP